VYDKIIKEAYEAEIGNVVVVAQNLFWFPFYRLKKENDEKERVKRVSFSLVLNYELDV
jgi:hypothetical protein